MPSEIRAAGYWGFLLPTNPEQTVTAYRMWLERNPKGQAIAAAAAKLLRGKYQACWCRLCEKHQDGLPLGVDCPDCEPCHVNVLLEIANQ